MEPVMATAAAGVPPGEITYGHISKRPGVCGGKPCIEGTRVRVLDIVVLHEQGLKPEEMLTRYSSRPLTLSEVHAALAYYYDHREEIAADFARDRQATEESERRRAEYLNRRATQ